MKIDFRGLKTKSLDISKKVWYTVFRSNIDSSFAPSCRKTKLGHPKLEITQNRFVFV